MLSSNELDDTQEAVQQEAMGFCERVIDYPKKLLQQDILDPALDCSSVGHENDYMRRANRVALGLMNTGLYSLGEKVYRDLLYLTLEHNKNSGVQQHTGALRANMAICRLLQGNLDGFIIQLYRAAEDDAGTYCIPSASSYALTGLLREHFVDPARDKIVQRVQPLHPAISTQVIESVEATLGEGRLTLWTATRLLASHMHVLKQFDNEFSRIQAMTALIGLTELVEARFRWLWDSSPSTSSKSPKPPTGMKAFICRLYKRKPWWPDYCKEETNITPWNAQPASVHVDIGRIQALNPSTPEGVFWQSLLACYLMRNYVHHHIDGSSALTVSDLDYAFSSVLDVLFFADQY